MYPPRANSSSHSLYIPITRAAPLDIIFPSPPSNFRAPYNRTATSGGAAFEYPFLRLPLASYSNGGKFLIIIKYSPHLSMRVIGRENRIRARTQEAIFPYRCSRKMISAPAIYGTRASERYLHITRDAYVFSLSRVGLKREHLPVRVSVCVHINASRRYFDPGFDGGYVRCYSLLLNMGYSKARLKYINDEKIDGL